MRGRWFAISTNSIHRDYTTCAVYSPIILDMEKVKVGTTLGGTKRKPNIKFHALFLLPGFSAWICWLLVIEKNMKVEYYRFVLSRSPCLSMTCIVGIIQVSHKKEMYGKRCLLKVGMLCSLRAQSKWMKRVWMHKFNVAWRYTHFGVLRDRPTLTKSITQAPKTVGRRFLLT